MKLKDILQLLSDPDRLRIIKAGKDVFVGYLAMWKMRNEEEFGLTGEEEVERFRVIPEIRHKHWKEKDLMPPLEPNWTAQYNFADLEMKLYYTITLKEGN